MTTTSPVCIRTLLCMKQHTNIADGLPTMKMLLFIALMYSLCSKGNGSELSENFIKDILSTWRLTSPTLIYQEVLPDLCKTSHLVLCVENNKEDMDELTDHLAIIHQERRQDSVIFVESRGNKELVRKLDAQVPIIFRSKCPVFMPIRLTNDIKLRLDSNIIFYEDDELVGMNLLDIFAVKGGPPITLHLGHWSISKGITLLESLNRWDRRTDLKGTNIINALACNANGYFIMYVNGTSVPSKSCADSGNATIIGSMGPYQDLLFYITGRLNVTITTLSLERSITRLKNGSWTGSIGVLQRKEADIVTTGLGLNLERSRFVDYLLPTKEHVITLIAPMHKKSSPNLWVYLQVFGAPQWVIFSALLLAGVIIYSWFKILCYDNGCTTSTKVQYIFSGIGMTYLYLIQTGNHTNDNLLAMRILSYTIAFLTMLMFICYSTDITAEMTTGTPELPIRNFEDVIHHGYKVTTGSSYFKSVLATAKIGTAKHHVYKTDIEDIDDADLNGDINVMEAISKPKTLYYGSTAEALGSDNLVSLKMDDEYRAQGGLVVQRDSEFLEIFNYYVLKAIEHGIIRKIETTWEDQLTEKKIGINEPQPLGYENVTFLFVFLGSGVFASIFIGLMELMIKTPDPKAVSSVIKEEEMH